MNVSGLMGQDFYDKTHKNLCLNLLVYNASPVWTIIPLTFIHTRDIRMFLIGRQPVINTAYDLLAGHKQAAPEPMSSMYALCVSRICVNKRARLTRSANNERADNPNWPAWAPASTTFLSIYKWQWHKNWIFIWKLLSFFHTYWLNCSEC